MEEDKNSFMGFNYPYKDSKVVILQAPFEGTSTYMKNQKQGPKAIIDASNQVETYDIELKSDFIDSIGIHTNPALKFSSNNPKEAIDAVQDEATKILADNKFPLLLGGEHSISLGAIQAAFAKYEDITVLQIDAHADMRDKYEKSKYNHACVMARVREFAPAVAVGIRSYCKEEAQIIKDKYSNVTFGPPLDKKTISNIISKIKTRYLYITIDVDGFDPSIMPATGTPEPGGLDWYDTLSLLKEACKDKEVVGADIVELAPIKGQIHSDFTCAKLAYKLCGYVFSNSI